MGDNVRTVGRSEARKQAVAPWLTVVHALGLALLMVTEYVRQVLDDVGAGATPPRELEAMGRAQLSLAEDGWYTSVVDIWDAVSLEQGRAALWAAVFFALVVRFNKEGPEVAQRVLSYVTGVYCVLAVIVGLPYVETGLLALVALLFAAGILNVVTRK